MHQYWRCRWASKPTGLAGKMVPASNTKRKRRASAARCYLAHAHTRTHTHTHTIMSSKGNKNRRGHHRVLGGPSPKSSSTPLKLCLINVIRKQPPCSLGADFGVNRSVVSNVQGQVPPGGSVAPAWIPRIGRAIVDAPTRGGLLSADHALLSLDSSHHVYRWNGEIPCVENFVRKGNDCRVVTGNDCRVGTDRKVCLPSRPYDVRT